MIKVSILEIIFIPNIIIKMFEGSFYPFNNLKILKADD